jgi:hypothetical protein
MLAADKLLLTSSIRQNATELKGKELSLHKTNFDAVGTQAAVLAGFAVGMLVEFHVPENTHAFLSGGFYTFAVFTLVANLRCVAMTTCITVMGTGLALRGPEGSMAHAVEGMYKQRFAVFLTFGLGISSCLISAFFLCWIKMRAVAATSCSLLIVWAMFSLVKLTLDYRKFFNFSEDESVSLDDLLGSSAVSNDAVVRQLGVNSEALMRLVSSAISSGRRAPHTEEHQV